MFSKSYSFIIFILVFNELILDTVSQGKPSKKKRKTEIVFDNNNYNGIVNGGRFPGAGGPIGNLIGTGNTIKLKKGRLSGLAKLIDDRFITIDRLGNPHGGMPEDLVGHVMFCAQFVYNGLFSLIFLTIRYPLKIVTKAIYFTGCVGFIITYANWCINPLVALEFTANGRRLNQHLDKVSEFRDELKKRVIWITDRAQHRDRQMYACCAFHEYKRKIYEEVPEALNFAKFYFSGLYKLPELVYCWRYQMGSQACAGLDMSPTDEEPDRTIAQSIYTHYFELFDKFF